MEIIFAKAKLFRNTQTITKMNPYLVIKMTGNVASIDSSATVRTNTIKAGGKNPIWNHRMVLPVSSFEDTIKVICYDQGIIKKAIEIGRLFLPLSELACVDTEHGLRRYIPLLYQDDQDNKAGEILVITKLSNDLIQSKKPLASILTKPSETAAAN